MPLELALKPVLSALSSLFAGEAGSAILQNVNAATLKRNAIKETDKAFDRTWHVKAALTKWTKTPSFEILLWRLKAGDQVAVEADAVASFIKEGAFASGMGDARTRRAEKVVVRFFDALLRLSLKGTDGLPIAVQRLEIAFRGLEEQVQAGQEEDEAARRHMTEALAYIKDLLEKHAGGTPGPDPDEALARYCRHVVRASRHLPLRGVDIGHSDPTQPQTRLDLEHVYIALNTSNSGQLTLELAPEHLRTSDLSFKTAADEVIIDTRRQRLKSHAHESSVLRVVAATSHLVILGDPGSGKSTFVRYLALCLAAHRTAPAAGWLERLSDWKVPAPSPIPIPVVLRDFARSVTDPHEKATPRHLWDFIVADLHNHLLDDAAGPLQSYLEAGQVILLLDGLDEIPTKAVRTFVRDAVTAFLDAYSGCRTLITCRTLSYQDAAWKLAGVPSVELAPFDKEQIDRFIEAWYNELARAGIVKTSEEADTLTRRLQQAVRREDLWRLAPNPLLLTVMALVHTHKGRLPEARALLYEETVDILLWRWEQIKTADETATSPLHRLLLDVNRTEVDLKRTLWRLAFEAHAQGGIGDPSAPADIDEVSLRMALAGLHPEESLAWADAVIEAIKLRAGLLLERAPAVYAFPHRTFQEYLAGAHLASQVRFAEEAARLAGEGAFWREVILLAVGKLVHVSGEIDRPLALVSRLCPAKGANTAVAWRKAWVAGEVLLEIGLPRVRDDGLGAELFDRVTNRLVALLHQGALEPKERAEAGRTLARLGDPRDAVTTLERLPLCYVPEGPFRMGSDKTVDEMAFDDEEHLHTVAIPYAYWISKHPVTQAQYAVFVEAGGYENSDYWTPAGWQWREHKLAETPASYGEPYDLPNHPVVGVSWYEAMAFTRWLTARGRAAGWFPEDWSVGLPSEAEWEKAARGGVEVVTTEIVTTLGEGLNAIPIPVLRPNERPERRWPWQEDAIMPDRANYDESGIGTTSAVGAFPNGESPYGAQDLSGNVLEWTRNLWGKGNNLDFPYPYNPFDGREDVEAADNVIRVLRGGAFDGLDHYVRCAVRNNHSPYSHDYLVGFRVVLFPCLIDGSTIDEASDSGL